jgi:putative RecB family exonuclease
MTTYPVPTSLSPSRVDSFTTCPLQFRFASIERLPEAPSIHSTKGSFVHRVLERLFEVTPEQRNADQLEVAFTATVEEYAIEPELVDLGLDDEQLASFHADARRLAANYLRMEDPTRVRAIGLELRLEADVNGLSLRGIIDRLDLDDDGGLVVVDYKSGRPPMAGREQQRMDGIHTYSLLCEAVFGVRPAAIKLMYLSTGETITAIPSEQSVRFVRNKVGAVWKAIARSCETGDFRPKPSRLCAFCSFTALCPAFASTAGDVDGAGVHTPAVSEPAVA